MRITRLLARRSLAVTPNHVTLVAILVGLCASLLASRGHWWSVAVAGVLLVFCFLIVPSVTAMLFSDRLGPRLAIGWTMGALVSAEGVLLSFYLDLPTGATIVGAFGSTLLVVAAARFVVRRLAHANSGTAGVVAPSGTR
jgi:ABC-type Mn2+/Zn2+ transport system permease subunit